MGSHVVIPEKQFTEAGRINLGNAGEVQYDVMTARFLGRQDARLDASGGVATKLTDEGEDFCLVLVLFTNLKDRTYLRVMRRDAVMFTLNPLAPEKQFTNRRTGKHVNRYTII